ncbi:FecR family protein [Sphingobium estronivorans]|uniref:FecR family protein n=1 Tax=Sphingobium estronivorans TaxID=1577690 RepID=UPI0013C2E7B1|nr:FecR domain-containing protein [Sphingobium estronivorans]
MTMGREEDKKIEDDAAQWVARFNSRVADRNELQQFFAWKKDPRHAAAYERVNRQWESAQKLGRDPQIACLVDDAIERTAPRPAIHRPILWVAGAVIAGAMALGTFLLWPVAIHYETGIGEQRLVRLEDGTSLHLDSASAVDIRFSSGHRRVALISGRALFEVAHDKSRPFDVDAGAATVRALGTRFEIDRQQSDAHILLIEGKVRVDAAQCPSGNCTDQLLPGDMVMAREAGLGVKERGDVEAITSWTTGRLQFQGRSLAAAVDEVNRYSRAPIILEAPDLAEERVNGGFAVGDRDAFIRAVTALYPLRAEPQANGAIRLVPDPARS